MTEDKGAMDKMKDALEKIRSCLPKDPNQSVFPWTANKLKKIIDEALGCPIDESIEKGAGEGPYTYYERADGRFIIEGPGVHMDGGAEHLTRNEVCRLNMVFALGRQRGCTAGHAYRDGEEKND